MEKAIKIVINGIEKEAVYKEFKTGNKGYGFYGKLMIDGKQHQISLNIIELK